MRLRPQKKRELMYATRRSQLARAERPVSLFPEKQRPRTTVEKVLRRLRFRCQERERRAGAFALFSIQDVRGKRKNASFKEDGLFPSPHHSTHARTARTKGVLLKPANIDGGQRSTEAAYIQCSTKEQKARWFSKFEKTENKKSRY